MVVQVRLGAGLAQRVGAPRLSVTLADGATVADLLDHLQTRQPEIAPQLQAALPVLGGHPVERSTLLAAGQEVALVLPVAGGAG